MYIYIWIYVFMLSIQLSIYLNMYSSIHLDFLLIYDILHIQRYIFIATEHLVVTSFFSRDDSDWPLWVLHEILVVLPAWWTIDWFSKLCWIVGRKKQDKSMSDCTFLPINHVRFSIHRGGLANSWVGKHDVHVMGIARKQLFFGPANKSHNLGPRPHS